MTTFVLKNKVETTNIEYDWVYKEENISFRKNISDITFVFELIVL
tara:strand:+ start:690 stop:824 length:135 start_codon:yes stop_codon:yes gene_type:complete